MSQYNKELAELYATIDRLTGMALWGDLTKEQNIMFESALISIAEIEKQRAELKASEGKEQKRKRKKVSARWKSNEVWWAKQTGGKLMGHARRGKSCTDIVDPMFSSEVKSTASKLSFIEKGLRESEINASGGRVPVLVIFVAEKLRTDGYVILRIKDWLGLHY